MSDDISLFHPRMRKPAVYALTFGLTLGLLAVVGQRISDGAGQEWYLAIPYGLMAAAFLYGVMYRNISQRVAQERS